MVALNPTPVPGYGLAPPTPEDALAFLARGVGADRAAAVWMRACQDAGVPGRGALTVEQMMHVAERLGEHEGVVGVIGKSLVVRARTYRLLSGNRADAGGRNG